ncbi:MAG: radical SAM protein, partial [Phycisphaeraceae bacterium]|nr:radical SAM protein [Phycisphaeraceae bacterium]
RHCGVNRLAGETGYCGLDATPRCFRELLHDAEESCLNPSHQVYFSGCNLRCEYCSVEEWITDPQAASPMNLQALTHAVAYRKTQGARTLNLLGGEPTVSLPGILKLLSCIDPYTQVVWNSNMYYSDVTAEYLAGLVDITLADLKCGNESCAARLLDAPDYVAVARQNIVQASQDHHVIIRCLLMPGHQDCCLLPTLNWIAKTVPKAQVSLRADYVPPVQPVFAAATYTTQEEYQLAQKHSKRLGLALIT